MNFELAASFRDLLLGAGGCEHGPLKQSESPEEAADWAAVIQRCPAEAGQGHLRWLGQHDLFFLLVYILNRKHFIRNTRTASWTFNRCAEVQADPDGHVDLWPRESFKSEIITFGKTIQDIITDPERTFGIFSHTRPMASTFLMVIRREMENNELLKELYKDVLWADPRHDCLEHSLPWTAHAITIKRKGNPKEATIEAWGLTDGQPTSRRFSDIVYDDVTSPNATSEIMIRQTTTALENSFLLTASDPPRYRYIATYQEIGDTTQHVIDREILKLRRHGPTDENGNVAYCTDEKFADLRKKLSPKVFALQILLDPAKSKLESDLGFKDEWLEYYDEPPIRRMLNVYGLVDPAGDNPDSNSEFALWVVGVGADRRVRVLDVLLDKLDLEESWQALFTAQQKWECLKWGYEKYGMQRDLGHYKYRMGEVNYHFTIIPLGGIRRSKNQRIAELVPWFRDHRIILPRRLIKQNKDGRQVDLIKYFKEREYGLWPYNPRNRDMLDGLARIADNDLGVVYPRGYGRSWASQEGPQGSSRESGGGGWMAE